MTEITKTVYEIALRVASDGASSSYPYDVVYTVAEIFKKQLRKLCNQKRKEAAWNLFARLPQKPI